jgi:SAM-dependent methyltransferase
MVIDAFATAAGATPSRWIVRFAPLIAPGAPVLDLACGTGRHARLLAGAGHPVVAVDRDAAALGALAGLEGVEAVEAELEAGPWPLGGRTFGGVVVTNYLHRPRLPAVFAALGDDGVLLYETFATGNEAYGRPSNPDFLLRVDELLELAAGRLTVVAFEQGLVRPDDIPAAPAAARVVQRIAAVGKGRSWPPSLPAA